MGVAGGTCLMPSDTQVLKQEPVLEMVDLCSFGTFLLLEIAQYRTKRKHDAPYNLRAGASLMPI